VAKLNSIRVLLSLVFNLDWELFQLDIKNAFLNGKLEEEIYMKVSPGFEEENMGKICKLYRSLYGLKQSSRVWFKKFSSTLINFRYKQGATDYTLFTKHGENGNKAILIMYVDDIIIIGDDIQEISTLKHRLGDEFEVKDLGEMKYFLGMEVARNKQGILIS